MSEIKVNKISPRTNCGTVQLGDSGDTITIPAGATITNNGTQTGFGRTGAVDWQTSIKTTDFTASNGEGYFVNTSGGSNITVTLPSSPSAGNIVAIADYAGTAATNKIIINRNGSNFEGGTANGEITTNRQAVTLVFADSTQGWLPVGENDSSFQSPLYVAATGGTLITCGDYKIHTFTSPGTFCVTCAGNSLGNNKLDYLVVAGGGSAGGAGNPSTYASGGGGAGGYRESRNPSAAPVWTASPLATCVSLTASSGPNAVAVGGGGAAATQPTKTGGAGSVSTFMTITSAGGGGGLQDGGFAPTPGGQAAQGGSGGGGGASPVNDVGNGNVPSVTPAQGTPGGFGSGQSDTAGGGGGGAASRGLPSTPNAPTTTGGTGGNGAGTAIHPNSPSPVGTPGPSGPLRYFAGGGGGGYGYNSVPTGNPGPAPYGGGGAGTNGPNTGNNGQANTGGGGGGVTGSYGPANASGGTGGSGIVIIRYKFQN